MDKLLAWVKDNPQVSAAIFTCLISPGLLAAGSATKEAWDAWVVAGVPWGRSTDAIEQAALWEVNAGCFRNKEFTSITNESNVEVGTLVCPTGDILVSVQKQSDEHPTFKWIKVSDIEPGTNVGVHFGLFSRAYATGHSHGDYITKIIYIGNAKCKKLTINKYTGTVVHVEIVNNCRSI